MKPSRILPKLSYARSNIRTFPCMLIGTIVLLALGFMSAAGTQAQTPQQKDEVPAQSTSTKGSLVRGRVIYEDTRRPLRRVQVSAYDPASKGLGRYLMAWTNARGEFQFKDVPAGRYFVAVEAPGIIRPAPFDGEESQADLTAVTVDGTAQAEVMVRVKRGGAISGKVTYADGDPVVNASMRVLRKKDGKWIPVYVGGRSGDRALTDERGVYRVSGLSPGEYLLGAAEEKMGIELSAQDDPDGGKMVNRALLSNTYYDGAVSLTGATALRVEAGDEKTDINITLAERSAYSVSGIVMLRGDQRPIARARISLKRKDEELNSNSSLEDLVVNSDEEGRFVFDEVPEGIYMMTVTPPREYRSYETRRALEPKTGLVQKFAAKHQELNVAGDITSLLVEVSSGGRLSGVLSVEGGKPLPRTVFIFLEPASRARLEQLSAQIQADGKFTFEGIPAGSYYLRTAVQPDNEYYTKSVMHGRSDITREPVAVKEGEDISDVRMVISADVARLSGRLLAADGKSPERGVGILFVPADPAEQKTMSRRIYGVTNADGGFRVSGAPGDYVAIVLRRGENAYMLRDDQFASRVAKAQRVTLQPGENSRIDLTVPSEK
jgi:hypothetical protein